MRCNDDDDDDDGDVDSDGDDSGDDIDGNGSGGDDEDYDGVTICLLGAFHEKRSPIKVLAEHPNCLIYIL